MKCIKSLFALNIDIGTVFNENFNDFLASLVRKNKQMNLGKFEDFWAKQTFTRRHKDGSPICFIFCIDVSAV